MSKKKNIKIKGEVKNDEKELESSNPNCLVLVYTGNAFAFRLKEFKNVQSLINFISKKNLSRDEFAILYGRVISVTEAYRDGYKNSSLDDEDDNDSEINTLLNSI